MALSPELGERSARHVSHSVQRKWNVRISNRPFGVKRFQTIHPTVSMSLAGSCISSDRHQALPQPGWRIGGANVWDCRISSEGALLRGSALQAAARRTLLGIAEPTIRQLRLACTRSPSNAIDFAQARGAHLRRKAAIAAKVRN